MMKTMTTKVREQLQAAVASQNLFDLYDAMADNGLETAEVYAHGSNLEWMMNHAKELLNQTDKATARPKIRYNDGGFEVEFRPGEWGQFACTAHTRWTYPDENYCGAALRVASEGLPDVIVRAVNEYEALKAVAVAAQRMDFTDCNCNSVSCRYCGLKQALAALAAVRK